MKQFINGEFIDGPSPLDDAWEREPVSWSSHVLLGGEYDTLRLEVHVPPVGAEERVVEVFWGGVVRSCVYVPDAFAMLDLAARYTPVIGGRVSRTYQWCTHSDEASRLGDEGWRVVHVDDGDGTYLMESPGVRR